ncbi:MAG: lysophospholipase [Burkholderiaceae bacterium]|nr:lysophospholipase [Burkholderiaceae bacterium]
MRLPSKLAASVIVAIVSALAITGCASIDRWQREAIFQTEAAARVDGRTAPDGIDQFDVAVPGGGVTGRDSVRFWYAAAADADAPTVLYLHGARHNLYGNANRVERLRDLGFNVLALDYRGFGRSTRILPTEASAIEDARLAFAELQRRQPVPSRRLVYGYSLGGAVAIALAQQVDGMAGVVIESSFTSIADVVRTMRWGWVPFVNVAVTQNFNSLSRIAQVNEPLLFLHGTADTIVPHTMSDRLAAAAESVPAQMKKVVKIEGASHRGAMSLDPDSYGRALDEFVRLSGAGTQRLAARSAPAVTGTAAALGAALN